MTQDEPLFQIGICPNCPPQAEQRFLFATEERHGAITEQGRIVAYNLVETRSLFRCEKCGSSLLYSTILDSPGGISVEDLNLSDPAEVAELDPTTFQELSTLEWPTKRILPSSVPKSVQKHYNRALEVRAEPNSFAVQIRRALEAICIERGERGKNLNDDLERLSKAGVFPPIVAEIAHELRDVGNTGAHAKSQEVKEKQIQAIDDFFHLVVNYVYEAPARLEEYRNLLNPKTKYVPLDGSLIVS